MSAFFFFNSIKSLQMDKSTFLLLHFSRITIHKNRSLITVPEILENIISPQVHGTRAHRWTSLRLPDPETGLPFISSQAGILFPSISGEVEKHLQGASYPGRSDERSNQFDYHRSLETSEKDSGMLNLRHSVWQNKKNAELHFSGWIQST